MTVNVFCSQCAVNLLIHYGALRAKTWLHPSRAASSLIDDPPPLPLQVWDGAKWRKMISSQAGRTLSPTQLFSSLIYSTGHLVHPLTEQLNPIHKTLGKARWIIGSVWSGGLPAPLCIVLKTLNLQMRKKWFETPHGKSKERAKCCVYSPLGNAAAFFTIIFVCRVSS